MTDEAKEFLEDIGSEINKEKSATNNTCWEDTATLLEGVSVYKYLGIIEDSRGIPTRSSFEEVQSKLISRIERLCHNILNAKKLFSAINQHAISLINYHIGVLRLEPADFSKLDDAVRAVLVKNKIHLRPGFKNVCIFLEQNLEEAYIVLSCEANICFCHSWIVWKKVKKYQLDEQQSSRWRIIIKPICANKRLFKSNVQVGRRSH
ncbi:hypothetical protein LUQ84_001897 [Hamiltosporidium tvaerminnensis]|nr:hypothetical protein LUQ84_001897 [Hamiltosporidium tvaerminnensis]